MVELNGFETNDNDYFTIQCGPTFGSDDILDAVAPNFRNSIYAEVDFYDLTYMRCDYIFTYVHFDYIGDVTIMQQVDLEIPSEDHPTAPKQPHLIYAGNPNTMRGQAHHMFSRFLNIRIYESTIFFHEILCVL